MSKAEMAVRAVSELDPETTFMLIVDSHTNAFHIASQSDDGKFGKMPYDRPNVSLWKSGEKIEFSVALAED